MIKDDTVFLNHMNDAITWIEKYVHNIPKDTFLENHMIQDAVIRQIELIGEASKLISSELKIKHSDIPWKDMAGMRDRLIHHYFGVDLDIVWNTVKKDIPFIKEKINAILE